MRTQDSDSNPTSDQLAPNAPRIILADQRLYKLAKQSGYESFQGTSPMRNTTYRYPTKITAAAYINHMSAVPNGEMCISEVDGTLSKRKHDKIAWHGMLIGTVTFQRH